MNARATNVLMMLALAGGMAGCASTPNSHFYTLNAGSTPTTTSTASAIAATASSATVAPSVSVGPVSVAALLDRPQIVVGNGPNQVLIDEFNRWASPLQDNIANVVAQNLAVMLGTPRVTVFPQSAVANAAYHVTINVQSIELNPGASARLDAVWTLRRNVADAQPTIHRTDALETVQGTGYDVLIAATSRGLGRMSRQIADAILEDSRAKP
jgi:uncharacterized protein